MNQEKNNIDPKVDRMEQYEIPMDRLLPRKEAAKIIGVKHKTLTKWASTGKYDLPFIKSPNGQARYRYGDLIEFLERYNPSQKGKLNNIGVLVD